MTLALLASFGLTVSVTAQMTKKDVPKSPKSAPPISVADVEELRKKAVDSPDLSAAVKKQLGQVYDQAVAKIKEAEQLETQTAALQREVSTAAGDLKKLQSQLSAESKWSGVDTSTWTLQSLQARTREAETADAAAKQEVTRLQTEIDRRIMRRTKLPELIAAAMKQLDAIEKALKAPSPKKEPAAVSAANRTLLLVQRRFHTAEIAFLNQETSTYSNTAKVWTARHDVAKQAAANAQKTAQLLKDRLGEMQSREAEAQARAARKAALNAHPAVKPAADRNSELLDINARTVAAVEKARRELETAEAEKESLQQQFEQTRKRAEAAKYSQSIGQLLRQQKARLSGTRVIRDRIRSRQEDIGDLNLRIMEWESERKETLNIEAAVKLALRNVPESTPAKERDEIAKELQAIYVKRVQVLAELIENTRKRLDRLVFLNTVEQDTAEAIDAQKRYIAEHILWVRSAAPLGLSTVQHSWSDALSLLSLDHWSEVGVALTTDFTQQSFWVGGMLLLLGGLVGGHGRLKDKLRDSALRAGKRNCTSLRPTLNSLMLTVLIAAPIPAVLAFLGWRLVDGSAPDSFANAFGTTLLVVAAMLAALELISQTCRPHGLGFEHFGWDSSTIAAIRFCVHSLQITAVPIGAIVVLSEAWGNEVMIDSVGRLAFLAAQIVLGLAVFRLLRPSSALMSAIISNSPQGLLTTTRRLWTTLLITGPFLVAVLSAVGYHYTAIQLMLRMLSTFGLFVGLAAIRAILLRWLLVTHRQFAIQRHRERIAAQALANEAAEQTDGMAPSLEGAVPEIGLKDIKQQTRDLIRIAAAIAVVGGTWFIWTDVLPALGILNRVRLWPNALGSGPDGSPDAWVTLGDLLLAAAIAALTFLAARNVPGFAEMTVLKRLPLDAGARYAASSITRYMIVVVGLIFSVRQIGIGWSSVQWLVAAMTVGLGFGLQEIFANFVSGMILLFERPIRVGDTVTVGDITGTVTRIRIRATTILDWDNKELIVPNKQFVTGNLTNWTLSNSNLRVILTVGIAYGSDVRLATKLLYDVARENDHVLEEPEPVVVFTQFGDNSLNLELRLFVTGVMHFRRLKHELNQSIDDKFKQHGIVIAFPQRDLHLRSIPEDLFTRTIPSEPSPVGIR